MAQLAAAVLPSAIGAISSLFGGNSQAKAVQKATNQKMGGELAGIDSLGAASDFLKQTQTDNNNALLPYQAAGIHGLNGLTSGLAPGGNLVAGEVSPQQILQQNPGYQFALDQGSQAIQRGAIAQGQGLSGGELKDLTSFAQGNALQAYQQAFQNFNTTQSLNFDRLSGLAGIGQNATNERVGSNLATAGGFTGIQSGIADLQGQVGTTQAAGTLGASSLSTGGIQGLISGAGSILSNPTVLKSLAGLFGGGGGGG